MQATRLYGRGERDHHRFGRKEPEKIIGPHLHSGAGRGARCTTPRLAAAFYLGICRRFRAGVEPAGHRHHSNEWARHTQHADSGAARRHGLVVWIHRRRSRGSELFTEQTTLAILPLLSGNASVRDVARLWGIVYVANLIGAALCAAFITLIGPALAVVDSNVFAEISTSKVEHPAWVILLSGVLGGWIMGLLSWLVAAGRDTISQIVIIWIFTGTIGLAHLHHSILGTTEVLGGLFSSGSVSWGEFGHFLLWATIGNAVGGACFVAVLKFGHAQREARD